MAAPRSGSCARSTSIIATRRVPTGSALIPRACIAVDWCGAIADERRRMWLVEARLDERRTALGSSRSSGSIVRLECGRSREEIVAHLIECARSEPRLVVGLDFAFSFPRWFLEARNVASARAGWELAAREGESWLAHCPSPFWGRPGVKRPKLGRDRSEWRATEGESVRVRGIGPKSVFQVGGAGSVGTGSLRGMPHLIALQDAGFSIWPFDAPRLPMVVEIYPRYLTGPVNKSSRIARALYIQNHHADERRDVQDLSGSSEDAFDAAVSAAVMVRARHEFARLERGGHRADDESLEGRIWMPLRDPMFAAWPMTAARTSASGVGARLEARSA
jgi:hypothetical protein